MTLNPLGNEWRWDESDEVVEQRSTEKLLGGVSGFVAQRCRHEIPRHPKSPKDKACLGHPAQGLPRASPWRLSRAWPSAP